MLAAICRASNLNFRLQFRAIPFRQVSRGRLSTLIRYCSARGIRPASVDDRMQLLERGEVAYRLIA